MELSPEDALRLNVLLANDPQSIRIDEGIMVVHVLSENGDGSVKLNPTCRDAQYLRLVRELFSGHVMGSPGGYPVYLTRWTRMGQARDQSLEQLLLLGEPEAVVAVVGAKGLTDELARRAWWAMPDAANARRMLRREAVVSGEMGAVLADFLVEFLPFEEEPGAMMESARLVLQGDLITPEMRAVLWEKGQKKNAYLIGFLRTLPDDLPRNTDDCPEFSDPDNQLSQLVSDGNPLAEVLQRVLSPAGRQYVASCETILGKPINQDVVNALFDTIADYFSAARPSLSDDATLEEIVADADRLCGAAGDAADNEYVAAVVETLPGLKSHCQAILCLSRLGYPVVRPIFSKTSAIGSLMRRKLEPVSTPLMKMFSILRS